MLRRHRRNVRFRKIEEWEKMGKNKKEILPCRKIIYFILFSPRFFDTGIRKPSGCAIPAPISVWGDAGLGDSFDLLIFVFH